MSDFAFGPAWARDTGCCGKPVGCTNMTGACLMRRHWWKQRYAQVPGWDDPDGGPRDEPEEGHEGAGA
jgi:hypothetical protein